MNGRRAKRSGRDTCICGKGTKSLESSSHKFPDLTLSPGCILSSSSVPSPAATAISEPWFPFYWTAAIFSWRGSSHSSLTQEDFYQTGHGSHMLSACLGPQCYRPGASSHFPLSNPPGPISICLLPWAPTCTEQENSSKLGDQSRSLRGLATYLASRSEHNAKLRTHSLTFGIKCEHLSAAWNTDLQSSSHLSLPQFCFVPQLPTLQYILGAGFRAWEPCVQIPVLTVLFVSLGNWTTWNAS